MANYDYCCVLCGITQVINHPMSAIGNPILHCSTPMVRQFTAVSAIFKGKGWGKDK